MNAESSILSVAVPATPCNSPLLSSLGGPSPPPPSSSSSPVCYSPVSDRKRTTPMNIPPRRKTPTSRGSLVYNASINQPWKPATELCHPERIEALREFRVGAQYTRIAQGYVKWKGFESEFNTWVNIDDIPDHTAADLLDKYLLAAGNRNHIWQQLRVRSDGTAEDWKDLNYSKRIESHFKQWFDDINRTGDNVYVMDYCLNFSAMTVLDEEGRALAIRRVLV